MGTQIRKGIVYVLWAVIVGFYLIAVLNRALSFDLDDLPLREDKCVVSLYNLRASQKLDFQTALEACPTAKVHEVEPASREVHKILSYHTGSDASTILYFDNEGNLSYMRSTIAYMDWRIGDDMNILFIFVICLLLLVLITPKGYEMWCKNASIFTLGILLCSYSFTLDWKGSYDQVLLSRIVLYLLALLIGFLASVHLFRNLREQTKRQDERPPTPSAPHQMPS